MKHQSRGVIFFYCKTPSHGNETYLNKKIAISLYYIFQGEGGREVLDLYLILFIKSELLCRRFALLSNSEILFHKIAIRSNTAIFKPALHLTGAKVSFLCSQRHYVPPITLF